MQGVKGTIHTKIKNTFFLLPVVLLILLDGFGMNCSVSQVSAVKSFAFTSV